MPESVVVVMVMMMVVVPVRDDHDPRSAISVMMVVVVVILRELDIAVGGRRGPLFVDRLQEHARIRDRLQQLGIGVGL
jgi:hypothetical protein